MIRATDKLIALQFLAVALPIAGVMLLQMSADAHRAASLSHSRPLRILADDARANFKTFTNGAADAVDSGILGAQAAEALHVSAARLRELSDRAPGGAAEDAAYTVERLVADIPPHATLKTLLPLRGRIMAGDALTKRVDAQFVALDERVVEEAIRSAVRQKREVSAALVLSCLLTIWFVAETRQRLKARVDADIARERRRRAEVEAMSVRFAMATRAARAGVYELQVASRTLWWSDTMHELYGRTPGEFQPTLDAWLDMIHPEDRVAARRSMDEALRDSSQLRSQYRILRPDGSLGHVASLAAVITDPLGGGPRLVGIDLDVTARVEAEARERELQLLLRDASRRAGMAEIATNVLHNVGNVLNSVNISAGLVTDRVRNPRVAALDKVATLLRAHDADLPGFLADERGRQLPGYVAQLAEHLRANQALTLEELDALRQNIDHIKEIVAMQQSYSKLVGVPERLAVATLVEDALRMNAGAFERHGVALQRDFAEVPEIVVERHKVLQILVNLLRNAKYACDATGNPDKRVRVAIARHADGVRISVADNGMGIEPEHLPKIFSHGFTTKKDGHGFGLHSGAATARDLGGTLRVTSPGPGLGATFTLDLPLQPPEQAGGASAEPARGEPVHG